MRQPAGKPRKLNVLALPPFCRINAAFVRLRAHRNSRVRVPDLADTVRPVTESNCIGAISPGGEQLEVNHQSITRSARMGGQSELDSVSGSGELANAGRSPNKIVRPALREWNASGRGPRMVGDRMVGSSGDVDQGTTAGDEQRAGRGQSVRRSEEASNDRGAKGRRKAVLGAGLRPSRKDRRSAARLIASGRWKTAWPRRVYWQWAARNWVSGSVRTARLACSLRASRNIDLSQSIDGCRLESWMREIRPSSLGGRGSALRSSYPHRPAHRISAAEKNSVVRLPLIRLDNRPFQNRKAAYIVRNPN
jgi:hypothetical protein